MKTSKVAAAGSAIVALSIMSVAWACSPQAKILSTSVAAGPAGTALTINGQRVAPEAGQQGLPVEVRWNDLNGTKIGEAQAGPGGDFSAQVTIPEVRPGVYSIVAGVGSQGVARTAFEVTASQSEPASGGATSRKVAADLWTGFNAGSENAQAAGPQPRRNANQPALTAGLAMSAVGGLAIAVAVGASRRKVRRSS